MRWAFSFSSLARTYTVVPSVTSAIAPVASLAKSRVALPNVTNVDSIELVSTSSGEIAWSVNSSRSSISVSSYP